MAERLFADVLEAVRAKQSRKGDSERRGRRAEAGPGEMRAGEVLDLVRQSSSGRQLRYSRCGGEPLKRAH
jgi:hypothetical protein